MQISGHFEMLNLTNSRSFPGRSVGPLVGDTFLDLDLDPSPPPVPFYKPHSRMYEWYFIETKNGLVLNLTNDGVILGEKNQVNSILIVVEMS